jgi:hypothetical protein
MVMAVRVPAAAHWAFSAAVPEPCRRDSSP